MTQAQELEGGAAELGVALHAQQQDRLLQFAALLRRWNAVFNLVSRRDAARLIARHLLDSLSLAPMLCGVRVLDLGTGAGLPGVPLAVARPDVAFTLIDRNERRIRFVRQAIFELGLPNVTAVVADFAQFRAAALFDTVVSRAVAEPAALWRVAAAYLEPHGQALLQTGAQEREIEGVDADVERVVIRIPRLARPHQVLRMRRRGCAVDGAVDGAMKDAAR